MPNQTLHDGPFSSCSRTLLVPDPVVLHGALDWAMRHRKASRGLP